MANLSLHSRRNKALPKYLNSNCNNDGFNKTQGVIDTDAIKKEKRFKRRRMLLLFVQCVTLALCLVHLQADYKQVIDDESSSILRRSSSHSVNERSSQQSFVHDDSVQDKSVQRDNSATNKTSIVIPEKVNNTLSIQPPISVTSTESLKNSYKFAYAFLMAGCDPKKPTYMGYIYNAVISKEILRVYNSTADVVIFVRMHARSGEERLPDIHESILTKSGLIVKYLPKPRIDNFHTAQMDKFRILELDEYDRILYLDSDVMPLNNLDYIFEKSVGPNAPLQENCILAYTREPANGGFFMLKPDKEDYKRISKIVKKMNKRGYKFDEKVGFGHEIVKPDYWESIWKRNNTWSFYGAFTDQGLLYHWVKYEKKKFSAIIGKEVKTFDEDEHGNVEMVRKVNGDKIFHDVKEYGHLKPILDVEGFEKIKPYQDFQHFFQKTKPWFRSVERPPLVENVEQTTSPLHLWYHMLRKTNNMYNFGIYPERFQIADPPLGVTPDISMVNKKL